MCEYTWLLYLFLRMKGICNWILFYYYIKSHALSPTYLTIMRPLASQETNISNRISCVVVFEILRITCMILIGFSFHFSFICSDSVPALYHVRVTNFIWGILLVTKWWPFKQRVWKKKKTTRFFYIKDKCLISLFKQFLLQSLNVNIKLRIFCRICYSFILIHAGS